MKYQTHPIKDSLITTITDIFFGDFSRILDVKQAVLHLKAIYFCHSTSKFINLNIPSVQDQLLFYQNIGLLPESTVSFFKKNKELIFSHWPEESVFYESPDLLYAAFISDELSIRPESISFESGKVSRDIAGAYYTSPEFANVITRRALDRFIEKQTGIAKYSFSSANISKVRNVFEDQSFLDYSCGSGEFLLATINYFKTYIREYPLEKLASQLHGIDVDPIAVMVTLARIIKSADCSNNNVAEQLQNYAKNFIIGNPLLHAKTEASLSRRFENFALNRLYAESEGISYYELLHRNLIVLGNPPWEKLRFEERAFFRPLCSEISLVAQKDRRAKMIDALASSWPELAEYYALIKCDYANVKKAIQTHPLLKGSLVGELNTYALFADLASNLIGENGFAAIIVKSALVTSPCYAPCFKDFLDRKVLSEVFLYDNRERIFPIDSREKFCILFFGKNLSANLAVHYGMKKLDEMADSCSIDVSRAELEKINPETGLLPNVQSVDEFSFLCRAHKTFPVLATEYPDCHFGRLVHLTAHADHILTTPSRTYLPIFEGKFIAQYDNRYSTFAGMSEKDRYKPKASATRQDNDGYQIPKPLPECRYYVSKDFWASISSRYTQPYSLCWRSLTSPTNQRTMIASVLRTMPTCQSIQMLQTISEKDMLRLLALFNSKVFDYFVRIKMSGIDLTQSIVRQVPVPRKTEWSRMVTICGKRCTASDAVFMLQKLIFRNEPDLAPLFSDVETLQEGNNLYHSSTDIQEEIDRIVFQLYSLTGEEERVIRASFSV